MRRLGCTIGVRDVASLHQRHPATVARHRPKVTEVLLVLYLRGISTRDFEPALSSSLARLARMTAHSARRKLWRDLARAFVTKPSFLTAH